LGLQAFQSDHTILAGEALKLALHPQQHLEQLLPLGNRHISESLIDRAFRDRPNRCINAVRTWRKEDALNPAILLVWSPFDPLLGLEPIEKTACRSFFDLEKLGYL